MRAPQSAPVQPQVHTPPPQSMRVQPQVPVPAQASPQRVAPPPAPQAAPQPAPQPRSAPDSGSHGQRDTPPGQDRGQDSSGSGNMQRQGR
jgi:hypothetical protein